ncbi:MAG TPA: hypothetical protein VGQ44_19385 [Gemmatimonadaceae bacterium]|jgi:hypothetical protein|nr:hypothetical protein [Gemmatimonadaceae bacterium]
MLLAPAVASHEARDSIDLGRAIRRSPTAEESAMAICEVCGNDYEMSFQVVTAGQAHTFDSFECAIQKLAPVCEHCGCKVIGHGVEADGSFYCCAHCAHSEGADAIVDNAAHATH